MVARIIEGARAGTERARFGAGIVVEAVLPVIGTGFGTVCSIGFIGSTLGW